MKWSSPNISSEMPPQGGQAALHPPNPPPPWWQFPDLQGCGLLSPKALSIWVNTAVSHRFIPSQVSCFFFLCPFPFPASSCLFCPLFTFSSSPFSFLSVFFTEKTSPSTHPLINYEIIPITLFFLFVIPMKYRMTMFPRVLGSPVVLA